MPLQSSFGAYALFRAPVSGSHPVRLIAIDQLSGCTAQANTTFTVSSTPVGLTGISLYETSANVLVGGTLQLHAFPQPFNADISGLIWESADTAVATVADGVVTGLAVGSALIKVTAYPQ